MASGVTLSMGLGLDSSRNWQTKYVNTIIRICWKSFQIPQFFHGNNSIAGFSIYAGVTNIPILVPC